jgi:two-component system, chemotaxis family, response regulator Rcp1
VAKTPIPAVAILVVEDNPAEVRRLKALLKERAIPTKLYGVARGEAALAFLRHEGRYAKAPSPQVIFLDLQLPGREGCQLLEEIGNDPALRAIPVVLFSRAEYQKDHLVAAGLVAAYLTQSLGRVQYMELLEKLPRRT